RERARQILAMNQADEKTRYLAQRLLAESFLEEEAYLKTEEEIRKAIALIPKGREKDRPLLEKALASSLYKQGEELRNREKLAEAAQIFVRVSLETPTTSIAPMALYDAGTLYAQTGDLAKAVQTYELLSRKYPDSPYVQTSLLQWGDLLQNQGRYLEAAPVYERVASLPGRDSRTLEESAYLAGLMYEKAGDWANTQRAFLRYRTDFPEGAHVVEALFKAAETKQRLQDRDGAFRLFQEVIALQKKVINPTPEDMTAAARAQFAVAEEKKVRLEEVPLLSPLEKNLTKKKNLLKETLEGFTAAARYRINEITTASTYRMGETLEHFRDALLNSERPSNLTPEQMEQYNFLLEEQVYPFEEKAVAAYENNVRRTQETGLYDSWIRQSYDKLAVLLPVKYQRVEEGEKFEGGEVNTDALLQIREPDLLNSTGIYFREQGEFAKAESTYRLALQSDPRHPAALFNLGILYELYLNKPAEAAAQYKAYLQTVKTGVDGAGEPDEKEKRYRQIELWIAALEKQTGGTP
ncbi:MAG: tetratricopeptide repeat protein, partial [Nitrospirae bacterium]|nr:tetratricopeptide repeat protein [Nitrospirota bacterium]